MFINEPLYPLLLVDDMISIPPIITPTVNQFIKTIISIHYLRYSCGWDRYFFIYYVKIYIN